MHQNRHHMHYVKLLLKNKELRDMYVALSLKTLAISMVGIFIPIFLILERGLDLNGIIKFYLINIISYMVACPFAGAFASRYGLKKATLLSVPLTIFFYVELYYQFFGFNLNQLAIILGLTEALFWIPFSTHFMRSSDKKHRSEEIGTLNASAIIAGMAGPFFGGMLITFYGFGMVFVVVSILLFLSVFPLLFVKDYHEPFKFNLKDITMVNKKKGMRLMALGGTNAVERVFWPIYLFAAIGVYAKLGLVFFIAEVGAFTGAFWFGSYTNRKLMVKILKWGGFLCSLTWFARVAFEGILILSILTILTAFLSEMVIVPFDTLTIDKEVRRKYLSEYVVFRNIMFSVGWLIVLAIISIFESYHSSFITSGLMYLSFLI